MEEETAMREGGASKKTRNLRDRQLELNFFPYSDCFPPPPPPTPPNPPSPFYSSSVNVNNRQRTQKFVTVDVNDFLTS